MSENNVNLFPSDDETPGDFYAAGIDKFKNAPWTVVSKDGTLPEQLYYFKVINAYPGVGYESKEGADDGKFKFVLEIEVQAPQDYLGVIKRENFYIGSDDDPKADKASTWATAPGASMLYRLCEFLGVPKETPYMLKGHTFGAFTRNNKSGDNTYTNIIHSQYYRQGEMTPGITTAPQAKNYRSSNKRSQPTAPQADPNLPIACPLCAMEGIHAEFTQPNISVHIQGHAAKTVTVDSNESVEV